jgi:formylglycine-generating enzyme required for sulfatase activity
MKNSFFLIFLIYCFSFSKVFLQTSYASEKSALNAMILVPEGLYISGSNKYNDERPSRKIYLDAFYIDKFEVTQKKFKKIMGTNPSEFRGPHLPVDHVNWYEARDYCKGLGKRLPTEAEWEKAARSGTDFKYYWGEIPDDLYAWHWDNSNRKTHIIGGKKPNNYGLYDISGNVWEWTEDWYAENYYKGRSRKNPTSPFSGKHRVLRGGSFMDKPEGLVGFFRDRTL